MANNVIISEYKKKNITGSIVNPSDLITGNTGNNGKIRRLSMNGVNKRGKLMIVLCY